MTRRKRLQLLGVSLASSLLLGIGLGLTSDSPFWYTHPSWFPWWVLLDALAGFVLSIRLAFTAFRVED